MEGTPSSLSQIAGHDHLPSTDDSLPEFGAYCAAKSAQSSWQ
jgi:hypothetical protein